MRVVDLYIGSRALAALRALLAASIFFSAGAAHAEASLESLLQRFASMPGLSASFVDEKSIALLRSPLVEAGTIYFLPPDRIARHVTRPSPSMLAVQGDLLTLSDASGVRTLDLGSAPLAGAFVRTLRLVLAGDAAALRALHAIRWTARDAPDPGWTIELVPKTAPLREAIARIEITGEGGALQSLDVFETGGDATRTRFSAVDRSRVFTDAEISRLFLAAPK